MDRTRTVIINGRQYDPVSGLPIGDDAPHTPAKSQATLSSVRASNSHSVHLATQKSKTLRRSALKKPEKKPLPPPHAVVHHKKPAHALHASVAKSPAVAKFVPRPAAGTGRLMDIAPIKHPHVVKAQAKIDAKKAPESVKSSKMIKREAIQTAIDNTAKQTKMPKQFGFRHPGVATIITAAFALVVLGGYLTYLNMPALSVRVAAAAAGVDASYPNYRPDGYRLDGAVAYDTGQVSMKFAANAGPQSFTIKQTKSSWDSAAVLDNYVTPKAGGDYATYSDHGLTIYTFEGSTAWVNGGILYTIEGNARLSSEQIRHIATSFM